MFEVCGWIGAILVLYAYFMVSTQRVAGSSANFQMINILGALFLVIYTYNCQAYASMIVNLIWIGIGLNTALKHTKEVFMATRMKLLATALVLVTIVGSNVLIAQDMDYSDSEETVMEESTESTTEDKSESLEDESLDDY
jgi:hypothetical protein